MRVRAPCPCGEWEFRRSLVPTSPGVFTADDVCGRCGGRYLLAVRVHAGLPPLAEYIGSARLHSRDEDDLRRALQSLSGVTEAEVEFAMHVARALGSAA